MDFTERAMVVAVSLIRTKTSYRRLHITYFAVFTVLGTLSLWLIPKPAGYPGFSFMDALFCAVSALTVTGLATVEMHKFAISDLVTILILMIVGGQVFTSAIPLFIRRFIQDPNPAALHAAAKRTNSVSSLPSLKSIDEQKSIHELQLPARNQNVVTFDEIPTPDRHGAQIVNGSLDRSHLESRSLLEIRRRESAVIDIGRSAADGVTAANYKNIKQKRGASMPVLPTMKTVRLFSFMNVKSPVHEEESSKRSTVMVDFQEEKERLKKEAGALRALSWIVLSYWLVFQALGLIIVLVSVSASPHDKSLLRQRGVNRAFLAHFTTVSAFANAGYMPLDDSLVALNRNVPLLVWVMVLILAGNTLYAPTLRFIIWLTWKLTPSRCQNIRGSLEYLLTRPRRCYTHLFPRTETLWLLLTAVVFNGVQFAEICGVDWRTGVFDGLSGGLRVINGMFSSITTRNAGFNVVNTGSFSASTLVFAVGMMYVAVYPVYLSRQHSKEAMFLNNESPNKPNEEIFTQCRKLFARDSVYLFIAIFLICIFERHGIRNDPLNFSVFNIIFEVISGYGNVGLSIGYSCSLKLTGASTCIDVPYSFSGKWSFMGKLVVVIVMLLGRHRGLPEDVDWAIIPPLYE